MRTLSISMFCFVFYKVSVMIELLWITQVTSFVCFCWSLSSFWLCFLFLFFISLVGLSKEARGSLTSLLVQPISALLAKTLLSSPSTGQEGSCIPLAMPPNTGKHTDYRKPELLIMSHSTESVFKSMRVFFLIDKNKPASITSEKLQHAWMGQCMEHMSDTALGHVWIKPGIMIKEALCLKA